MKGIIYLLMFLVVSYSNVNASEPLTTDKEVIVLLHGFARSKVAMWSLEWKLENAGYYVFSVGYSSLDQDISEIKQEVFGQIDGCCLKIENKVHFVGHSMGGLIIRAYLAENRPKNLGQVVLIGTPNHGTEIVDHYKDRQWANWFGPAAATLGTGKNSFPNSLPNPNYPLGIIAGVTQGKFASDILKGQDDGMVTVESTKVEGMTDFTLIQSSHFRMRYNDDVASEAIHFLKHSKFKKN